MASKAPKTYHRFVERYPKLGEAWDLLNAGADEAGSLSPRDQRLVKLAIAIGAGRQGAVSAGVRKGLDAGLERQEIEQVIALAASTVGLPAAVAAFSWADEAFDKLEEER